MGVTPSWQGWVGVGQRMLKDLEESGRKEGDGEKQQL